MHKHEGHRYGRRSARPVCRLVAAVAGLFVTAAASAQMRVVTYNVAQLAGNNAAIQDVFQAMVDDDIPGFALAPHLIVLQEVNPDNLSPLQGIMDAVAPGGVTYTLATYANSGEQPGSVALFYRAEVLQEIAAEHTELPTGATRQTDRWKLRLLGSTDAGSSFYVYGSHLKAGTGESNEQERQAGVFLIRQDADNLAADAHVIYTGDFNIYHNMEPAYLDFLEPGPAKGVDPLGTGSWAGSANAIKHTQSPRLPCGGPLACGGMDDRFDFQLVTAEFTDGAGFTLMSGTYRSMGNDGNHYNLSINDGPNAYYPGDPSASDALADDLFDGSDHLPVIVEYRFPGRLAASLTPPVDRVILDAPVVTVLTVQNDAPAVVTNGAEIIDYTATATGAIAGGGSGTLFPLDPPDAIALAVDTTTAGTQAASVDVTSPDQGVDPVTLVADITVLRPADGSFSNAADVNATTVAWVVRADTGVQQRDVDVHNFGYDALQALLDIDAVGGGGTPFGFAGGLAAGISGAPATLTFSLDTTGLAGPVQATFLIDVSDEDIPGEATDTLSLTLDVTLGEPTPGDLDGDGQVTLADLCLWYGDPVDVDGDGDADAADAQFIADAAGVAIMDGNGDGVHDGCQDVLIINEVRIDQTGADDDEYFELAGLPGASLDGIFYLVIGDPGSGTIEEVVDLTGHAIGPSGFFLVAEFDDPLGVPADLVLTGNNPLNFENGDNTTHLLVQGFTGSLGQDLDLDDDGTLDLEPWTTLIDLIAIIEEENPPAGTEFHYGPPSIGPSPSGQPGHVFRCPVDRTWRIGSNDAGVDDTPGAENDVASAAPPCPDAAPPCPGDTNGDGLVDVNDLNNVILDWGTDGVAHGGDITGQSPGSPPDGFVDVNDLNAVIVGWGNCP